MSISLYDVTVRSFIQITSAVGGFLERARKHCAEMGMDPNELVEARIYPDMFPLRFQIVSVIHHSVGAIESAKTGAASIPPPSNADYAGLQSALAEAVEKLKSYSPEEISALRGRDVAFEMPGLHLPFVAEDFLLSFSVPNFHFHATTAYDILRMKGVPLAKRDYLGRLLLKR